MKFLSKTEAYLYTLYILDGILKKHQQDYIELNKIKKAIECIREFLENHEQNPEKASNVITSLMREIYFGLDKKSLSILKSVQQGYFNSDYKQTPNEKWENSLGRRFESQLQIELLTNPTDAMMSSVSKVSKKIISILNGSKELQDKYIQGLTQNAHPIAFGAFGDKPTYEHVRTILAENNPKCLTQIMFMQFKFAQGISRKLEKEHQGIAKDINNISDTRMYKSPYYADRGRSAYSEHYTRQMGLAYGEEGIFNKGLPKIDDASVSWVADCRAQSANLTSLYTRSLIENDTPYVAGPSGMTTLFIGQMLGFNVLEKNEQKHYMTTVSGYMVSGGFHSLHEVLGPVRHCLPDTQLLPESYHAEIPKQDNLGNPPNFRVFYNQMAELDTQFSERREAGYAELNSFMHKHYLPENDHLPWIQETKDIQQKVLASIKAYGARNKSFFTYRLNPDKSRGIKRADNYNKMLTDAKTDVQKLAISYALLISKEGPTLKKYVAESLGYSSNTRATKDLQKLIEYELRKLFTIQHLRGSFVNLVLLEKAKETLRYKVISKLVKYANSNLDSGDCYQSSNQRGVFESPLSILSELEEDNFRNILFPGTI